jgi:hypothetical protein
MDIRQQQKYIIVLRRLCGNSGILPTSYHLNDGIEKSGSVPHGSGGFADVWQGKFRGRRVALKVLRTYATDDINKVKKVSVFLLFSS